jgi:hypothetical protein
MLFYLWLRVHTQKQSTCYYRALGDPDDLQSVCRLLSCSVDALGTSAALDSVVPHMVGMLLNAAAKSPQPALYLALRVCLMRAPPSPLPSPLASKASAGVVCLRGIEALDPPFDELSIGELCWR